MAPGIPQRLPEILLKLTLIQNGFISLRVAVPGWVRRHVGYGFIGFNEEIRLYISRFVLDETVRATSCCV